MKSIPRVTIAIVTLLSLWVGRQPPATAQTAGSNVVYLPMIVSSASCRRFAFGVVGMVSVTNTVFNASVNEGLGPLGLLSALATARANHTSVMASLGGAHSTYINPDGSFSLSKWEQNMNQFRGLDVSSYVTDGTLLGDGMLDEPQDPTNWGNHIVAASDIDAAAQYLKGIFPTIPTFVGSWPTWLQSTGYHWQYLNGVFVPYVANRGSVATWIISQTVAAQAQGLAVYMNMNATAGGATGGEMTPAEMLAFGATLINSPPSRGMLMQAWAVDPHYWSRPDITPVLAQLSALAAQRQACQ